MIGHVVSGGDYGLPVRSGRDGARPTTPATGADGIAGSEGSERDHGDGVGTEQTRTRGEATPVSVTVGSGTATSGTDFAAVTGFTISIPANTQSHGHLHPDADAGHGGRGRDGDGGRHDDGAGLPVIQVLPIIEDGSLADGDAVAVGCVDRGGRRHATVTASLSHTSSEATMVTVSVSPDSPAVAGDYEISANQVTIAAGRTASTGAVTVTGVNNDVDTADKTVTVQGTAGNTVGKIRARGRDPDAGGRRHAG